MGSCNNCAYSNLPVTEMPCSCCDDHYSNFVPTSAPEQEKTFDPVNHPMHYTHGNYECIDVMVDNFGKEAVQHFCILNAFKYVYRSEHKNGIQDIEKAMWYLNKYLELEGEKNEG